MLVTVAWVIVAGLTHFDAALAFDFPERAWHARPPLVRSAWAWRSAIAMYDYLGYYQVCYLGDEVADPPADDPALDPDLGRSPSR